MSVDEVRQAMLTNKMADQLREIARLEEANASLLEANRALAADIRREIEQGDLWSAEVARLREALFRIVDSAIRPNHDWPGQVRCIDCESTWDRKTGVESHRGDCDIPSARDALTGARPQDSDTAHELAVEPAGTQLGPIPDVEVGQ